MPDRSELDPQLRPQTREEKNALLYCLMSWKMWSRHLRRRKK